MKHRCPICQSPTDSDVQGDFPFCGERCRLLDLGAWASEKYIVSDPIFDEEKLAPQAEYNAQDTARRKQNETIH